MTARALILSAFEASLRASDPKTAVATHLAGRSSSDTRSVWCIAVGKAAAPMLAGAIDVLGDSIQAGFLITKDDHIDRAFDQRFTIREASHPVLDERTLVATGELLEWTKQIFVDDRVLVLLSGGGSALLELPVDSVSLADFQVMTRALLNGGADIYQLNCVRSLVSQVKGGRLRVAIPAAKVETLALSDVLGNDPTVIASGPTVSSTRTHADAISVIEQLGVSQQIPDSIWSVLRQPDAMRSAESERDDYSVIADNRIALLAAAESLVLHGYRVSSNEQGRTGEARGVARDWVDQLSNVDPETSAILAGGELTVNVRGNGIGGRNTEFALAAALAMDEQGVIDWTIASLATDGQDATTGFAGAIVDGTTIATLRAGGIDPVAALDANDSATVLKAIDATVYTGPTGTNVNDLYFAVRNRAV